MSLLLDTQALLWLLAGDPRMRPETLAMLGDSRNMVLVSAASVWEMAIKAALGKLDVPPDIAVWLPPELQAGGIVSLAVTLDHAARVETLPRHHTDPFDRLLVAQATIENLVIVSADRQLAAYDVRLLRP